MGSNLAASQLVAAGLSVGEANAKGALFARAATALHAAGHPSDSSAAAVFVPGRIEVFGKHTDYCGGRSLLCAVERGMCFVAVARQSPSVRFFALDAQEQAVLSAEAASPAAPGHWANYPQSVLRRMARNFPSAWIGADIAMASDLPRASGLSSSSAMIVGTFMALARLNGLASDRLYRQCLPDRAALAGYLGTVENGQSFGPLAGDSGVGTFGGSQDHTAILCCQPDALSLFSFCPVRHQSNIPWPAGVRFVVADSGVVAEKTGSARDDYNRVSASASELVALWRQAGGSAGCLNDIAESGPKNLATLIELIQRQTPERGAVLRARLDQFLTESNELIPAAVSAFATGDWNALRQAAESSHSNASVQLRNQLPQTNGLRQALMSNGALAASAFGAGFGGSVWGLFDDKGFDQWTASRPGGDGHWFSTRPGCPATEIRIPGND